MTAGDARRVLSVDDDPVFQRFVQLSLRPAGYEVVTAEDGVAGRECLERLGPGAFDCVLTDYRMPRMDGLSLLEWLHARDASLAAVLVTAEGEKRHVEQSLRSGACDFLNKPVMSDELRASIAGAVEATAQRRRAIELSREGLRVSEVQRAFLAAFLAHTRIGINLFSRPKHEAGGDFFDYIHLSDDQQVILLSDVSGHDFRAAHGSAFFHGLIRGMLECGTPLEKALENFNARLLQVFKNSETAISIAVSALMIDHAAGRMRVITCGAPSPVWMDRTDWVRSREEEYSPPLGWFEELGRATVESEIPRSPVWLWTDGVNDLAAQLNASPLSVVYALLEGQREGKDPEWLERAADDIMVAQLAIPQNGEGNAALSLALAPLVCELYGPEQTGDIDALQALWEGSLRVALPHIPADRSYAVLLCSREAVLNALLHGCKAGQKAAFEIDYLPFAHRLQVHVSDPGPGHSFNPAEHFESDAVQLEDRHRGLMLIRGFAAEVITARNGAELILRFPLN